MSAPLVSTISQPTLPENEQANECSHTVDSRHDESNLRSICCACEMRVDLLGLVLVETDETVKNVVAGRGVVVTALVVGEVVLHWADGQLLLESIDLVQEQDYGGLDEPPRVANGVKQGQCFLHTVHSLVLEKQLIVLGNGNEEENGGHVLEAVDPLLSLRSLTTDVEHPISKVADDESCLGDTSSLDTGAQNVLVIGHIIGCGNALDVVEVTNFSVSIRLYEEPGMINILSGRVV